MTPDPKVFPWQSPYVSMDCNPISLVDPWGAESKEGNVGDGTNMVDEVTVVGSGRTTIEPKGLPEPETINPKNLEVRYNEVEQKLETVDLSFTMEIAQDLYIDYQNYDHTNPPLPLNEMLPMEIPVSGYERGVGIGYKKAGVGISELEVKGDVPADLPAYESGSSFSFNMLGLGVANIHYLDITITVGDGTMIIESLIENSLKETLMKSKYIVISGSAKEVVGVGGVIFKGRHPESGKPTVSFHFKGLSVGTPGVGIGSSTDADTTFTKSFSLKKGLLKTKRDSLRKMVDMFMKHRISGKDLQENNVDTLHIEPGG
jgi:hypothetical protein